MPEEPIYLNIPSVRSYITTSLTRWFVHAVEAKTLRPSVRTGLLRNIDRELKRNRGDEALAKPLREIRKTLARRNVTGGSSGRDIHFVIADSAAFYLKKPVEKTHTPQALELARLLNSLGNRYGVFIHYIGPEQIKLLPKEGFGSQPLFSRLTRRGQIRTVGPGAGRNIALTFAKMFHEKKYGGKRFMTLLRMDDDVFPVLAKVNWNGEEKRYRNFFLDSDLLLKGMVQPSSSSYLGFADASGIRTSEVGMLGSFHLERSIPPDELLFYKTGGNEDMDRFQFGRDPKDNRMLFPWEMRVNAPAYLVHVGKASTWRDREVFGSFSRLFAPVQPASREFFDSVVRASGVRVRRNWLPVLSRRK